MAGVDDPSSREATTATGDTVTLSLQADVVTLEQYADALGRFARLLHLLARAGDAASVRWEIDDLEVSSAITTARAVPTDGTTRADVERVVRSYVGVGHALSGRDDLYRLAPEIRRAAEEIAAVLDESGVQAILFESAEDEALVTEKITGPVAREGAAPRSSFGAVRGRVQTLTSRKSLRFTLYDLATDRAVSCYVRADQEELLRGVWGKLVDVGGRVTRDPLTGRPLNMREIKSIVMLSEGDAQDWKRARGALPRRDGEPGAEVRIRRIRDAD